MKLDPVKVTWIVTQKERGSRNSAIAASMEVPVRRVQGLHSAYRATGTVPELRRPGRKRVEATDEEKDIIGRAYARYEVNALTMEGAIVADYCCVA